MLQTRLFITTSLFLATTLLGCAQGPSPMAGEEAPPAELEGEPAPAGLPGEAIDPEFEGIEMPDDGDEDPGADFPDGQP